MRPFRLRTTLAAPAPHFLVAFLVLAALACDMPTGAPEPLPAFPFAAQLAEQTAARLGERAFADGAAAFPGSAGFYFDEDGRLVIRHTDPSAAAAFADWVTENAPNVARTAFRDIVVLGADYDYPDLARWREIASAQLLPREGVHSVDLDEVRNRVVVGVDAGERVSETRSAAVVAGIPAEAIEVLRLGPAIETATLDDFERPLRGALLIQRGGPCTLGWTARQGSNRIAITASHCTSSTFAPDQSSFWQWNVSNSSHFIGYEFIDPWGSPCGAYNLCRYADAAAIRLNAQTSVSFGYIARTTSKGQYSGSTVIAFPDSLLTIAQAGGPPWSGQPSEKIGRSTGWTYGVVTATCVDMTVGFRTKKCSYTTNAGASPGDSGAPVFLPNPDGTVWLDGILWGSNTAATEFHWSLYDFVAIELGAMDPLPAPTSTPPGPSLAVSIQGPLWIETAGQYLWEAMPSNGSAPYSYSWEFSEDGVTWYSTVSSKTYQTYVSELDEPYFWLRVTVLDSAGDSAARARKVAAAVSSAEGTASDVGSGGTSP